MKGLSKKYMAGTAVRGRAGITATSVGIAIVAPVMNRNTTMMIFMTTIMFTGVELLQAFTLIRELPYACIWVDKETGTRIPLSLPSRSFAPHEVFKSLAVVYEQIAAQGPIAKLRAVRRSPSRNHCSANKRLRHRTKDEGCKCAVGTSVIS